MLLPDRLAKLSLDLLLKEYVKLSPIATTTAHTLTPLWVLRNTRFRGSSYATTATSNRRVSPEAFREYTSTMTSEAAMLLPKYSSYGHAIELKEGNASLGTCLRSGSG